METHCTKGLMPLRVAQKIAVVSSALLHTATRTLSSGEAVLVNWMARVLSLNSYMSHLKSLLQ